MLLLDKGYYDYDYEKVKSADKPFRGEAKSDEEVRNILVGFGFNHLKKKPETTEEIQNYIIKQESYGS